MPRPPAPAQGSATNFGAGGMAGSAVGSMSQSGNAAPAFRPRQVATDQAGAFEFTQLPAGSYRLSVSGGSYSGQYIAMAYGATKPNGFGNNDPGKEIDLSEGQIFDKANIALPRGAVIAGRVTDDAGMPLARVQVSGLYFLPGSTRSIRTGGGVQTDDLGQFRLFGLQTGEYLVVAEARNMTFAPPNQQDEPGDVEKTGFLTTYYPSAPDEASAQHVRTRAGAETTGVEIRLASGRMYKVAGMVMDSQGQPATGAMGQLVRRGGDTNFMMSFQGFSTDPQGRFKMQNVPAGDYNLVVRLRPTTMPTPGQPPEFPEAGVFPVSVNGADVDNVLVTTGPGATVTGRVVFEPAPPAAPDGKPPVIRIMATYRDPAGNRGLPSPPPVLVQPDQSFTIKGLMDEYVLRVMGTQPSWYVRSITAGADDVMETPRRFTSQDQVTVVISTRASSLDGNVTDAKGAPVSAVVLMFGEDKATWRSNSLWTRRTPSSQNGRFTLTGLRPGRYYIIALPSERLNVLGPDATESVFEEFAKDATTILINDDEQRTIDLRMTTAGG